MAERLCKKDPVLINELIDSFIREMKLSSGLNTRRVYAAWSEVSHMDCYTSSVYFKDGILTVTFSSSVARSRMFPYRESLLDSINEWLQNDDLFVKDERPMPYVKQIIMR